MKPTVTFLAVLFAALLAGCDTFERRSQEKAATFAALSPEQRDKLKHGVIEIGDTPDMVFIALGRPDEKRATTAARGRETIWIYNSYRREYEGNLHTGYHRLLIYDPASRRYTVFLEPVYTDIYSEHVEENIRINFLGGKVVQIEQPKPQP